MAYFDDGKIAVSFIEKENFLGLAYLTNTVFVKKGDRKTLPVRCNRTFKMDERIKLSPLCDVTKILRLTETEIRFGHDELSVTVQNTTEEDITIGTVRTNCFNRKNNS